jgi:hypothetical protein
MRVAIFVAIASSLFLANHALAQSQPPSLCKPCLFYGGDLNPSDPSAEAFANEDTLSVYAVTYGAVKVPGNRSVLIEGILFQTVIQDGDAFKYQTASYEIRTDVIGNGGTLVGAGGGFTAVKPTGRQFNGGTEYTIAVKVDPPVELDGGQYPGTEYWFNLTPNCTNQNNPTCQTISYLVSNTSGINGLHLFASLADQIVFVWPQFNYNWSYCYEDGFSGQQCGLLSFGLMGTVVQ